MRPSLAFACLLFFLTLFQFIAFSFSSVLPVHCHNDERLALMQFKQSFIIDKHASAASSSAYPKVDNWKFRGGDCCSWDGIECDEITGQVIGLDLSSSCLYGSINSSSSLFHLVHLQTLNLAYNDFNYSLIPSALGNFSKLTYLNLSNSVFSGQIPSEISKLFRLSSLDLSYNMDPYSSQGLLELKMPDLKSLIQNLTNLKYLHLSYVDVASPIPSVLANFSSLTSLNLEHCGLQGKFPLAIFQLPNLQIIQLTNNLGLTGYFPEFNFTSQLKVLALVNTSFSGELPASIGDLVSLEFLRIGGCNFRGLAPSTLGNLTKLNFLDLGTNFFRGLVPSTLGNLTKLHHMDLKNNYFTGELPDSIGNLISLKYLDIHYCNFTGLVPAMFDNLTLLKVLDLGNNSFGGDLPASIGNLVALEYLDVSSCKFTGLVPAMFRNLTMLRNLSFGFNSFGGDLPASIGNLVSLEHLDVRSCKFTGLVPTMFGNLTMLRSLYLGYNSFGVDLPASIGNLVSLVDLGTLYCNFTGLLPAMLGNLTMLKNLYLGYNSFGGDLPASIGNLVSLKYLDVSYCNFTGLIPAMLGNLTKLEFLGLGGNRFRGSIPSELMNLTQLTHLSLLENMLQGSIPSSISRLKKLEFFDCDQNRLNGTVEFDTFLELKHLKYLFLSLNDFHLISRNNTNVTSPQLVDIGLRYCHLRGFPYFLRNQHQLQLLDLSSNNLEGQIPDWMSKVSIETLLFLDLSNNSLTGFDEFPVVLPWSNLDFLKLDSNILQGSLPVPPFSTIFYSILNNSLTGEIPQLLCNLSSLSILDISHNNLSGEIPQCLSNFSKSLLVLKLRGNNFYGPIPGSWASGNRVKLIDLGENKLQGKIPRSLMECKMLEYLDLGQNQISDAFPSWMGTLPELNILIFCSNELYGMIGDPETNFVFPKLRIIDLSHNRFNGTLPSGYFERWNTMRSVDVRNSSLNYMLEYLDMTINVMHVPRYYPYSMTITNKGRQMEYPKIILTLVAIDLSSNRFDGKIPESIGNLKGLRSLNFSNNMLVGRIPLVIAKLTNLEALDLSQNKLEGRIPWELTQLTFLGFFDVSHNHLTGPIPQGQQFDTFQSSSFDGNLGLCGKQLLKECGSSGALSPPPSTSEDSGLLAGLHWKVVLLGYGSGFLFGVVIGHFVTTRKRNWFANVFSKSHGRRQRR